MSEILGKGEIQVTDALAINFCPNCGKQSLDLQEIVSKNTIKGSAADFYCNNCKASGIIDLDMKFSEAFDELTRIPKLIGKAFEDAGYTILEKDK